LYLPQISIKIKDLSKIAKKAFAKYGYSIAQKVIRIPNEVIASVAHRFHILEVPVGLIIACLKTILLQYS